MEFERRLGGIELRAEGRRLSGIVMRYGDVSPTHRERFEPGSIRFAEVVHLDLAHDPLRAVAWHPGGGLALDNGRDALTMRAELPPIPAADRALAEVRAGRVDGLSVEFKAVRERRDGGLRVIEEGILLGIGIVRSPSYAEATFEARRGKKRRKLRARVPADTDLACECSGPDANLARMLKPVMDDMWRESFAEGTTKVTAAYLENYQTPLASTARGTLRGRIRGVAGHEVDIDIPDSAAGRELLDAWDSSGLIVRPFIVDQKFETVGGVRVISEGRLRALIVTSTDARSGWPDPEMLFDAERAAQPAPAVRRRLYL